VAVLGLHVERYSREHAEELRHGEGRRG
jgi:hypothetical protein